MSSDAGAATRREPGLLGQTVVVIGGSAGIGLETARRARAEGADVVLTGRNRERLEQAADEVDAASTAAFDATDPASTKRFFEDLPDRIDHVMVTGPGPDYAPLPEMDAEQVRRAIGDHVVLGLDIARAAAPKMRPGGTLVFMGGTGGRKISRELGLVSAATAALPPFVATLALELAPIRVNLIAAGFVDTPLSASLLGERTRGPAGRAASDTPDRPSRWTRRRRGARGSLDDQHGCHGRDLRHRRRPTVRVRLAHSVKGAHGHAF
jgi:NAD(P)-dependent dehydrogenase (short-subunit alcohol dehydrogenase family)